jgi:hypothetical protein
MRCESASRNDRGLLSTRLSTQHTNAAQTLNPGPSKRHRMTRWSLNPAAEHHPNPTTIRVRVGKLNPLTVRTLLK